MDFNKMVTPHIKNVVKREIGLETLLNSTDEHLNDIPLRKWDNLPIYVSGPLSFKVCTAKAAARQIIEEDK